MKYPQIETIKICIPSLEEQEHMLSPLNATAMNVLLCIVGGIVIGTGFGAISNQVLNKTSLV